ncbi:MAG TPA: IS1 family transposase [Anaerolineae bacterium]|nr:IS1 family transposase [Anaerolineae bacterium]
MNQLSSERRAAVVRCLVEGNSIRATVRMTGAAKNTVAKLLVDLGRACADYQDKALQGLTSKRVQCDEIWSFVGCKQKTLPKEQRKQLGRGDVWTWTALDADTKLMICWLVGPHDVSAAHAFIADLASRLANRVQLTTDGNSMYVVAVDGTFGDQIDYGMLVKRYGADPHAEKRYSPAVCLAADRVEIKGQPDQAHISTSYVERQNLTMRMQMRRFTRLTNAFSKKLENHACAIALHFMHYNFARVHQTLKTTPAMAAGVADHVWSVEEIVGLLDSN